MQLPGSLLLRTLLLSLSPPVLAGGTDCLSVALSTIPHCAQSCYLEGAPTIGCDGLDFACQCGKQAAMFAAIEGCVAGACAEADFERVIDGSSKVCECAAPVAVGTVTVSGTVLSVLPSHPPSSIPVSIPVNTVVPNPSLPTPGGGSGNGSGSGDSPTRGSPTYFATSSVVSGAGRHAGLGLGLFLSAVAATVVL